MTQQATAVPYGALEIIETRMTGRRPADMVLVSLIGPLRELNPVVVAKPGKAYDWRFLVGLDVLVVTTTAADQSSVRRVLADAVAQSPRFLGVWFADRQDGFNTVFEGWSPVAKAWRAMSLSQRIAYAGMGSPLPADECRRQMAARAKSKASSNADRFDPLMVQWATAGLREIFGDEWESA
jgi:hypothetical protein